MITQLILHKIPYTPLLFKKKLCISLQMLLETFTFHHIVTSFHNGVVWLIMSDICFVVKAFFESLCTSLIELNEDWCDEVCNITNESQPPSNL